MYWISGGMLALEEGDKVVIVRDGGGILSVEAGDEGAPVPLVSENGIDTVIIECVRSTVQGGR